MLEIFVKTIVITIITVSIFDSIREGSRYEINYDAFYKMLDTSYKVGLRVNELPRLNILLGSFGYIAPMTIFVFFGGVSTIPLMISMVSYTVIVLIEAYMMYERVKQYKNVSEINEYITKYYELEKSNHMINCNLLQGIMGIIMLSTGFMSFLA